MAPKLYVLDADPPIAAVLMTARAIELDLEEIYLTNELIPEYKKLNPISTVPTLVDDDGFAIFDSHAIITYLVSKYAKDDSLYPTDLKKRAIVDQRLHFESGIVSSIYKRISMSIYVQRRKDIRREDMDSMVEAYGFLEKLLEGNKWAAGDFVSVADYSLISSVGSIANFVPINARKFPNVTAWMKRATRLPAYRINQQRFKGHVSLFKFGMHLHSKK